MRYIKPEATWVNLDDNCIENASYPDLLKTVSVCASICKMDIDDELLTVSVSNYERFVVRLIKDRHFSCLEFADLIAYVICSRDMSHELVRYRIASPMEMSQRSIDLSNLPVCFNDREDFNNWKDEIRFYEKTYINARNMESKEEARVFLPGCTATHLFIKANIREWRHIFWQRVIGVTGRPDPNMVSLMQPLLDDAKVRYPVFFGDITNEKSNKEIQEELK